MFEQAFKICMMKHEMDIDPFSLRCLVEVVSQRSITQAAQRLGMAQPSLSHVLARLRKHFGDPLLLRAGMTMTPTPRALRLAAAAEDVLDAMVRLHSQSTMGTEASAPPRFVMTCTDYYERLLAPALTRKMRELAPDTCMEWRTPDRAAAREWLERGEVDLRLAWVHSPWPGLRFRRLLEDRLVCLVRKGHPDVGMRLTETDFFRLPHVRPVVAVQVMAGERRPRDLRLDEYLGLAGNQRAAGGSASANWRALRAQRIEVPVLVQSFLAIPEIVANTDCIATVPALALWGVPLPSNLRVLQPPLEFPPLYGAIYWHERTNADPRQRWFRRLVTSVVQGLHA